MKLWQKSILFLCMAIALSIVVLTIKQISTTDTAASYRAFINGTIITLNKSKTVASAILLKGNKVLAVGNDEEILAQLPNGYTFEDLQGHVLLPGRFSSNKLTVSELENSQALLAKGITTVFVSDIENYQLKELYLKRRHGLIDVRVMINSDLGDELKVPPFIDLDKDERFYVKQLSKLNDQQVLNGDRSIEALFTKSLGSLEAGKMADFVVLNTKELASVDKLDNTEVLQTWLNGVRKY